MLTLYEWVKANNSNLLEEWDYEMNGSLRPDKVCNCWVQKRKYSSCNE